MRNLSARKGALVNDLSAALDPTLAKYFLKLFNVRREFDLAIDGKGNSKIVVGDDRNIKRQ